MEIGKSCYEIGLLSEYDMQALNAFLETQVFKSFIFKLRTKVERHQNCDPTYNTTVVKIVQENKHYNDFLIENIKRLSRIDT